MKLIKPPKKRQLQSRIAKFKVGQSLWLSTFSNGWDIIKVEVHEIDEEFIQRLYVYDYGYTDVNNYFCKLYFCTNDNTDKIFRAFDHELFYTKEDAIKYKDKMKLKFEKRNNQL